MADVKLSEIPAATTMATGDLIPFTTDPGGSPISKNITRENLFKQLALGSDADGDMYYRASSLLARLAKGTANHKLFMNAAGTAPEWASGIAIISSTRLMDAATGDVAYTGAGFKPSHVIVFANVATTTMACWGMASGTPSDESIHYNYDGIVNHGGVFIYLNEASGKRQTAVMKTMDADGFTLTWTLTGATTSATASLYFLCLR